MGRDDISYGILYVRQVMCLTLKSGAKYQLNDPLSLKDFSLEMLQISFRRRVS